MTTEEWIGKLKDYLDEVDDLIQQFPNPCYSAGWRILATADDKCRQLIMELEDAKENKTGTEANDET